MSTETTAPRRPIDLLEQLRAGRRVLWVTDSFAVAHKLALELRDHADRSDEVVLLSGGRERYHNVAGGQLWFTTTKSLGGQGVQVDLVVDDTSRPWPDRFTESMGGHSRAELVKARRD